MQFHGIAIDSRCCRRSWEGGKEPAQSPRIRVACREGERERESAKAVVDGVSTKKRTILISTMRGDLLGIIQGRRPR